MNKQIDKHPTIIIYKTESHDAFLAAYTFQSRFHRKPDIVFYTSDEFASPPECKDNIVIILGFTYPIDVISELIDKTHDLLVVDNTQYTKDELDEIEEDYKFIDMKLSVSQIAWEFFNKSEMPLLYKYVKADTLGIDIQECPKVDIFHTAFDNSMRNAGGILTFDNVNALLVDTKIHVLIQTGMLIIGYRKNLMKPIINQIAFCPFINVDKNILVAGYINILPMFLEDIIEECFTLYPFLDFLAGFVIDANTSFTKFYLRSTDDRIDLREIARHHNTIGGTHNEVTCILPTTTARLNYEHLDPEPFMCLYQDKEYKLKEESLALFIREYRKFLLGKFPGRSLKLSLLND